MSARLTLKLNNGMVMPMAGIGTFLLSPDEAEASCVSALADGYRLIDTANAYVNERAVGRAMKRSGLKREEIFLETKLWPSFYEQADAVEKTLERLDTDYIDLLLIHQPFNDYYGTWRAMEEAYKIGYLRAIGVSNFYPDRLVDLCQFVEVIPAVNQVETHVFQQQKKAHEYMEKYEVQHESWGPFAEGRKDFFTNPTLTEIGAKYGKSAAQTALRFLVQSNVVVIPKSTHKERMEQNFDVFDFSLSAEDMAAIQKLDEGESLFFSHYDPATVEMITGLHR